MELKIALEGLDDVVTALQATPRQIERANTTAVRETTRWAGRKVLQVMARENRIPQKAIKARRRVIVKPPARRRLRAMKTGGTPRVAQVMGKVWVGELPVAASALGKPTKTARGARIGSRGHVFPGAFVARMPSGHLGIYRRVERYPGYSGRLREPIKEVTLPFRLSERERRNIENQLPERLARVLRREVDKMVLGKARSR